MNADLLTKLETPGNRITLPVSAEAWEREALLLHVKALKAARHAVVIDEVFENGATKGELHATHYLSCTRCSDAKS